MQLAVEKNDLKDRKEISLYGSQPETKVTLSINLKLFQGNAARTISNKDNKTKQLAIKLDNKCISCSGNATHDIITLFKSACLNYEPTPLEYRNRSFSYEEIQELKQELMNK